MVVYGGGNNVFGVKRSTSGSSGCSGIVVYDGENIFFDVKN